MVKRIAKELVKLPKTKIIQNREKDEKNVLNSLNHTDRH